MIQLPEYVEHPAEMAERALLEQCRITRGRGSGPGGQHRNKVETAVHITHEPTGIDAQASERRSQAENQRMAIRRLRVNLAVGVRVARRLPTDLWESRVRGGRIALNPDHADFAPMLAEAMDHIAMQSGDVAKAAQALRTTTSQLVKLLKHEPRALEKINVGRQQRGLRKLQ